MHFGFALDSSDIGLRNIDLLDTHLDLLDADIPSKHFVCLQDRRRRQDMSSRRLQDISSRRLQRNNFLFWRRLQDVLKTSWKHLGRWKIITLKTCCRRANVCWEVMHGKLLSSFIVFCMWQNFWKTYIQFSFWVS